MDGSNIAPRGSIPSLQSPNAFFSAPAPAYPPTPSTPSQPTNADDDCLSIRQEVLDDITYQTSFFHGLLQRIDLLGDKISKKDGEIKRLNGMVEKHRAWHDTNGPIIEARDRRLSELQQQVAGFDGQREGLQRQVQALEAENEGNARAVLDLKREHDAAVKSLQQQHTKALADEKTKLSEASATITALESDKSKLAADVTSASTTIAALEADKSKLQAELTSDSTTITALHSDKSKREADLTSARQAAHEAESKLADQTSLQQDIDTVRKELSKTTAQADEWRKDKQKAEEDLASANQTIQRNNVAAAKWQALRDRQDAELATRQEEIDELNKSVESLEAKNKDLNAADEKRVAELAQMEKLNLTDEKRRKSLEKDLRKAREDLDEMRLELGTETATRKKAEVAKSKAEESERIKAKELKMANAKIGEQSDKRWQAEARATAAEAKLAKERKDRADSDQQLAEDILARCKRRAETPIEDEPVVKKQCISPAKRP